MTIAAVIEFIKVLGAIAGALLGIGSLFGLIFKRPRKWFAKIVREQSVEANKEIEEKIDILMKEKDENRIRAIVSLRHSITGIYEKHKGEKKLPIHVKEDLFSLYEQYSKLGGNSYVHTIVDEMQKWAND